jgi:hypothetical protein
MLLLTIEIKNESPEIHIIYISDYSKNITQENLNWQSKSHFIQKPFSLKSFIQLIEKLLDVPENHRKYHE